MYRKQRVSEGYTTVSTKLAFVCVRWLDKSPAGDNRNLDAGYQLSNVVAANPAM